VNQGNPASMRVMHKVGMTKTGVYELTDRRVFLAGEWRDRHGLHIFTRLLF
jgi:RimJ/RimL family protein N-acetyltransferase